MTDPAPCYLHDTATLTWGVATVYDLTHFVPPFHIE
jgi:hypothetical protein